MSEDGGRRRVRRRKAGPKGGDPRGAHDAHDAHDAGGPQDKTSRPVPKPADPAVHQPAEQAAPTPAHKPAPPPEHRAARPDKTERSLRGLVGAGPSQVSISAAMRARDAARPGPEDVAAAERDLNIVRRHYQPHDSGSAAKKNR